MVYRFFRISGNPPAVLIEQAVSRSGQPLWHTGSRLVPTRHTSPGDNLRIPTVPNSRRLTQGAMFLGTSWFYLLASFNGWPSAR